MTDEKKPKRAPAKKKTTPAGPAIPPFWDIEEKALRRLAAKVAKDPRLDQYKVGKIVRDANGGDYGTVNAILWHLVEHGLLAAEGLPNVLYLMSESAELGQPETVAAMLTRMGPHLEAICANWPTLLLLPSVPMYLERIVADAWLRDPAPFDARIGEMDPRLALAIAYVRRRFGGPIEPRDAETIVDHMASQLAAGGLTGNHDLFVSQDGQRAVRRLDGEDALVTTVMELGFSADEFGRRTVTHALHTKDPSVRTMQRALRIAPLGDVVEVLARCFSWGDCAACEQEHAMLEDREDSPEALFAAAEELVPGKTRGRYDSEGSERPARQRLTVRDEVLALAAARFAAENKPIPEGFEAMYTFEGLSDVYYPTIPRHLAAYRALPRERALALVDRVLAQAHGLGPAAVLLAAHADDERLRRLLEKVRPTLYVGERYFGLHGAKILPLLEAETEHTNPERRRSIAMGIFFALAEAAKRGDPVDPTWASYLRWDRTGPTPLKYWSTSSDGAVRDDALDAFPAELRRSILVRAATEEAHPGRLLTSRHVTREDPALVATIVDEVVKREGARAGYEVFGAGYKQLGGVLVDALCDAIRRDGADADLLDVLRSGLSYQDHQRVLASLPGQAESKRDMFFRKAAAARGPKCRVYLLERDGDDGYSAKAGTLSRIGGSVPGLPDKDSPTLNEEPMTPVLTLDLDEIPELGQAYPDARLLVLFHPDPEGGEDAEDASLVPVPRTQAAEGGDGARLAITPIDLPEAMFVGSGGDDPDIQDLRRLLYQCGGHVFGGPLWIQEEQGDSGSFLFQINDGLCDLNLGDVGSLYAMRGYFVFQCH